MEDLEKLNYLSQVFKEALRMYAPVSILTERLVMKSFKMADLVVRKGDLVTVFLAGLRANTKYFKDVFKFNPERFSKDPEVTKDHLKVPPLQQIPFSSGDRGCIGKMLGEVMVKLILIEMLKNFEITHKGWSPKFGFSPLYGVSSSELIFKPL